MINLSKISKIIESGNYEKVQLAVEEVLKSARDEDCLLIGEQLLQLGFLQEAEQVFERLLVSFPNESEILIILAEIKIDKGEDDQAILLLERITPEDDFYGQVLLLLADLYLGQGLFEVSEQKLLEAKRLLRDEPVIDYALGKFYAEQGQLAKALENFEIVIAEGSLLSEINVHNDIAEMLSLLGQFEEALPHFEKGLEFELNIDSLFQYGLTALQAKQPKLSIKLLTQLKSLDYEYSSLYYPLAEAYEEDGQGAQALETIEAGLKVDEFNEELYFKASQYARAEEEFVKLEENLLKAINLNSNYVEAVSALIDLYVQQERFPEIIKLIEDLAAEGISEAQYIWDLAFALENLDRYEEAHQQYEKAYPYFKKDEIFLNDYGFFLIEEGETAQAIEVFKNLAGLDPNNFEYDDILSRLTENLQLD